MIVIVIFVVFTLSYSSHAFKMHCPSTEQWHFRAEVTCSSSGQYTCLPDFSDQIYNESCSGPFLALPGERRQTSNNNFNIKPCTSERFQPFKFSSKQGSDCLLQKRKCSEEGLVINGNGTSQADRTCRCDYTRGFAFSSTDRTDPCSCDPATEDCSCYKKECNGSLALSPDYKCINEAEPQGTYNCSFISDTESKKPIPVNNSVSIGYTKGNISSAAIICTIVVVVFILVFNIEYWHFQTALGKRFEKDYFVEPLEERVHCFEGDDVTLSCTVNKKGTIATWLKNGSSNIGLLAAHADGKLHKLEIHKVKVEDGGYYTLRIKKIECSSLLLVLVVNQEQINFLRLLHLLETVAQSVVRNIFDREFIPQELKSTLDQNKSKTLDLLRDRKHLKTREYDMLFAEKMVEYYIKFKLQRKDYHKTKEIEKKKVSKTIENQVSSLYHNVKGKHEVSFITFEPGFLIVVKLTSRNLNDFKFLKSIIERAVIDEGYIGNLRTEPSGFSFIEMGEISVPVSSEDFDIRLMMILMKNLANLDISEKLPLEADTSESADLSRIKFIRNKLEQNIDKQISDEEFKENWKQLTEVVIRLDGKYESMCKELKKFEPSPHQCQKHLQSENMESVYKSVDSLNNWKETIFKMSIQKEARDAVQKIFDEQFPPRTLRTAIRDRSEYLCNLREQEEITQSQWNLLFPEEHENVSSGMFDTKLMIMLLKNSQLKETQRLMDMEYLNNLISETVLDCRAIRQALTEVGKEQVDFNDDCMGIL